MFFVFFGPLGFPYQLILWRIPIVLTYVKLSYWTHLGIFWISFSVILLIWFITGIHFRSIKVANLEHITTNTYFPSFVRNVFWVFCRYHDCSIVNTLCILLILFLKSNHGKFVVIQIKLFPTSQTREAKRRRFTPTKFGPKKNTTKNLLFRDSFS